MAMKRKTLLRVKNSLLALFVAPLIAFAADAQIVPSVRKDGIVEFGRIRGKLSVVLGSDGRQRLKAGAVEFVALRSNEWMMKIRAECPVTNRIQGVFFELTIPSLFKRYELDGVQGEFPVEKRGTFLGSGTRSFACYLPSWEKLTFEGGQALLEDHRSGGENAFVARFALERRDAGEVATFALDSVVKAEKADGRLGDLYRLPRGVPNFASVTFTNGEDWIEADFDRYTEPGSPLDFSTVDFSRNTECTTRFLGGNFSWSASFLEKELADRVADEVKRLGYNIVRVHQHDTRFLPEGATSSCQMDVAAFDRFDYFVAAMKKRGISLTTDCYSSRAFLKTDLGLGDMAGALRAMKRAIAERPEAMENWKAFTREFLCHVNPYTGLALKDDPVLVSLNLINEDNFEKVSVVKAKRKNFTTDLEWETWLSERQMDIHREQIDFLKNVLGVKAMLTSLNMCADVGLCKRRSLFDIVDSHMYFAHPKKDEKGRRYKNSFSSQIGDPEVGMIMLGNFFQRDWDRPFMTTEYRHCSPNVFRSECGVIVGSYAALQDWQAIVGYGYAESEKSFRGAPRILNTYDSVNDPIALMMDRQTALLYRRGDVSPSKGRVALCVPEGEFFPKGLPRNLPRDVRELGLFTGVGFVRNGRAVEGLRIASYEALSKQAAELASKSVIRSDTGELEYDRSNRVFKVQTERSEALLLSFGRASVRSFEAEIIDEGAASLSLHALDLAPIARSKRLLAFHLTDSSNAGTKYTDGLLTRRAEVGSGRVLIRRQRVRVRFSIPVVKVTALKCDGRVAGVIQAEPDGAYVLRNDAFPGGVLAYSIEIAES